MWAGLWLLSRRNSRGAGLHACDDAVEDLQGPSSLAWKQLRVSHSKGGGPRGRTGDDGLWVTDDGRARPRRTAWKGAQSCPQAGESGSRATHRLSLRWGLTPCQDHLIAGWGGPAGLCPEPQCPCRAGLSCACLSSPRTQKGASSKHPPQAPCPRGPGVSGDRELSSAHSHLKRPRPSWPVISQKLPQCFKPLKITQVFTCLRLQVTFLPQNWMEKKSNMCLRISQNFRKSKQWLVCETER